MAFSASTISGSSRPEPAVAEPGSPLSGVSCAVCERTSPGARRFVVTGPLIHRSVGASCSALLEQLDLRVGGDAFRFLVERNSTGTTLPSLCAWRNFRNWASISSSSARNGFSCEAYHFTSFARSSVFQGLQPVRGRWSLAT